MFDFESRSKASFNVKSERLTSQLVQLIEGMAKEKVLVEFQLETLNKQQENLAQKITHLVQSIQFIDEDFDTSTIRLQFDGGRLVRKKQFQRNVQDLVAEVMKSQVLWLNLNEITIEVVKLDRDIKYTDVKVTREQECSVANVLRRWYRQGLIERTDSEPEKRRFFKVSRWRLKQLAQ